MMCFLFLLAVSGLVALALYRQRSIRREAQEGQLRLFKALEALRELQKYNRLHHDLDDYLMQVALWGLRKRLDKPDLSEYGL